MTNRTVWAYRLRYSIEVINGFIVITILYTILVSLTKPLKIKGLIKTHDSESQGQEEAAVRDE